MSLTFGLFTQVSGSGPLGPLVEFGIVILQERICLPIKFFPVRVPYQFNGVPLHSMPCFKLHHHEEKVF